MNPSELLNVNSENRREVTRRMGRVIDHVEFRPGGVCCDIFLEKSSLTFGAVIHGREKYSKDGEEVKKWAYDVLKENCNLLWLPVISVLDVGERGPSDYSYNSRQLELHEIKIDLHRFYVAAMANGAIRSVEWEVPAEKRLTSQKTPAIWVSRDDKLVVKDGKIEPLHEEQTHILPYSEELWQGLQQLCKSIDLLQSKLHGLLKTEEGVLKLQNVGADVMRLLESPKDETQGLKTP